MHSKPRRARDPQATREAILEASGSLLAKDGPEGLSLSEVAHLAGVNRGTAYQHFETREKLIAETIAWASERLYRAVFGEPIAAGTRVVEAVDTSALTDSLADFARENPELSRVWLMHVLALPDPSEDMFWREYLESFHRFGKTALAEPDVDIEVMAVLTLAGTFLWPVWSQAHATDEAGRRALSRRFSNEVLRLSLYGSMRAERFPEIVERLKKAKARPGD